jgi:hypothetical protein
VSDVCSLGLNWQAATHNQCDLMDGCIIMPISMLEASNRIKAKLQWILGRRPSLVAPPDTDQRNLLHCSHPRQPLGYHQGQRCSLQDPYHPWAKTMVVHLDRLAHWGYLGRASLRRWQSYMFISFRMQRDSPPSVWFQRLNKSKGVTKNPQASSRMTVAIKSWLLGRKSSLSG